MSRGHFRLRPRMRNPPSRTESLSSGVWNRHDSETQCGLESSCLPLPSWGVVLPSYPWSPRTRVAVPLPTQRDVSHRENQSLLVRRNSYPFFSELFLTLGVFSYIRTLGWSRKFDLLPNLTERNALLELWRREVDVVSLTPDFLQSRCNITHLRLGTVHRTLGNTFL